MALLILPVPPFLLDALLGLNLAASVLLLLVSLRVREALTLSVFPSLLLLLTLFRLGLNIATTRLVLLNGGQEGGAGHVVESIGKFAVGGNIVIGAVVFCILLVVNFMVITKGSGRISEVAARFTLDALPGKQMSIDADLQAGLIDESGAKARRARLEQETEFFGAMDGASKFVRGDAVAGLIITGINIAGGLVSGLAGGMSLLQASKTYTILTIGDGLVSQIPALLISTAAGILVTRAGTSGELGAAMGGQLLSEPKAIYVAAGMLGLMALVPGMPTVIFLGMAGGAAALAKRTITKKEKAEAAAAKAKTMPGNPHASPNAAPEKQKRIQDTLLEEQLVLQLGLGLSQLIDARRNGELPGRLIALRRRLAEELGVITPVITVEDTEKIDASTYRLMLRGAELLSGKAFADRWMVLDPTGREPGVEGVPAKDPTFGLPARWVTNELKAKAQRQGLTVVDPASVVTTHIDEVIRRHLHEIVGRQEIQELLTLLGKENPKIVEEVVPQMISLGELSMIMRGLLREGISVRDIRTILETVAEHPGKKDINFLIEQCRRRLSRQISGRLAGTDRRIPVVTLDRELETALRSSLGISDGETTLAPAIDIARKVVDTLQERAAVQTTEGIPLVVVAPSDLRRPFFEFVSRFVPEVNVVTPREIASGFTVEPMTTIALPARNLQRKSA
ncbi:MAG: FHIPEP family type III secretion protein [Deltaproteobacteria bacterium]|nr:FHIPEP family type III secretion protein [Deltaproteobacteria bacterium]